MELDTSGSVAILRDGAWPETDHVVWDGLSPFTQGYVEALFSSLVRTGVWGSWPMLRHPILLGSIEVGFSDFAPETLARIIADCEGPRHFTDENELAAGRNFWNRRQAGDSPFRPLIVQMGDDGKVRFA